jgi:hypothetical protein
MARGFLLAATLSTAGGAAASAAAALNPFADVIGKWSGSGLMVLEGDVKERIACDAEHSGNALQLRLVIRCLSGERDIRMLAHLSSNAGRLTGYWEEKYFHALGAINGVATENRISFSVSGNVMGEMVVAYSKTRQKITITAKDVPLRSITIDMKRR